MIVQGEHRTMTEDEFQTFIFQAKMQEREACAKIAEREVWVRSGGVAARNVAKAIRTGKTDVTDEEMVGFTTDEPWRRRYGSGNRDH